MPSDLVPEKVERDLERGQLAPFYLFYGDSEFLLEKTLSKIRLTYIPEAARDFNLHLFYGEKSDKSTPGEIIDCARSLPFLSSNRLVIVRRTENFSTSALEAFIPYMESPVESTCLIFVSSKTDFRKKFYSKIRSFGRSVNFKRPYNNQIVPWIKRMAREIGLSIDGAGSAYLQQIVGNRLIDLYAELEKLHLRYEKDPVGVEEVKALAIYSRIHTVFELIDAVSLKQCPEALSICRKLIEEEGNDGIFKTMGMLTRQIHLLWQTNSIIESGGRTNDVARKLQLRDFQAKRLVPQAKKWNDDDLEQALHHLYRADGLLKSGAQGQIVLEEVILSLCS
ncbi:MAG: DNA polymerase III subunit delta [Desulfatiglans sp.]|jgi:DNA polymerase-3 subunit delta|nr:DNA polymerase III subunit delta [Thermodesulfobacteriota bacterium]MEE4352012.1 DNA polymerase III subunit delta [Desulfatiglans sp.]